MFISFLGHQLRLLFLLFATTTTTAAAAAAKGSIDHGPFQQSDQSRISLPSIVPKQTSAEQRQQRQQQQIGAEEPGGSIPCNRITIGLVLSPETYGDAHQDGGAKNSLRTLIQNQLNQINGNASQAGWPNGYRVDLVSTQLVENPIEMSEIVCKQLVGNPLGGVSAVIVDTDPHYIDSIASISFTLALYNIPVIGTTLRDSSLFNKNLHSSYISLIPPNSHQANVWYQLMAELNFKRAFVFSSAENHDLLSRLVDLVDGQQQSSNGPDNGDKFELEAITEYDGTAFADEPDPQEAGWLYLVQRMSILLDNSICRVLLVHAQSREDVNLFMNLIDHFNLTSTEGFALILSEETAQLAIESGLTLPVGAISSRLSLSDSAQIRQLFAMDALDIVLRSVEQISDYLALEQNKLPNSCQIKPSDIDWHAGVELYWAIRRQQFAGLTGYISFDENGDRLTARYELLNAIIEQPKQVADIISGSNDEDDSSGGQIVVLKSIGEFWNGIKHRADNHPGKRDLESKISINISSIVWSGGISGQLISGVYINRHLSIVTIEEKPFVWVLNERECWPMPTNGGNLPVGQEKTSAGQQQHQQQQGTVASIPCRRVSKSTDPDESERLCCKGYCMDLLEEISRRLNFTFDLYLAPDNQYGNLGPDFSPSHIGPVGRQVGSKNSAPKRRVAQVARGGHLLDRREAIDDDDDDDEMDADDNDNDYGESMRVNWTQDGLVAGSKHAYETNAYDKSQQQQQQPLDQKSRALKWGGLMGELVARRADMAFAPLTITLKRAQAIDFSKPFKFHGFSILLRRASKHTTLASFLQPFHNLLWILVIGVATHVVALTLYLLDRYSTFGLFGIKRGFIPQPARWPHKSGNDNGDRPLHLSSSIWFSWSILLNSGVGEHTPKSLSGRVLGIFWSGFAMIVVASYTANLAAFLVLDSREETPTLSGIDDPRLRSGDLAFNFATIKNSAVDAYLQSQVEYMNLYRKMEEFDFNNVDESIRALRVGTIDALIWDSTRLEWEVATDANCGLGIAGELFGSGGYGIGLQRDSHWTKNVTRKLLELHESGFMIELDKKWISAGRGSHDESNAQEMLDDAGLTNNRPSAESATSSSSSSFGNNCGRRNEDKPETLGIFNIAGVFIMFACGLITSMGLIVLERLCWKHRQRALGSSVGS